MAYTEVQRVQIRRYMGSTGSWDGEDPRLESAITGTLSQAEGGARADNSTETAVVGYLTSIAAVEAQLVALHDSMIASQIGGGTDTIKIDPARAMLTLRAEGRRYVGHLGDTLGMQPIRDVFSTPCYSGEP